MRSTEDGKSSPPPPTEPESAASADGTRAKGKRPWSKPTLRVHEGVIDVNSGTSIHLTHNDGVDPIYASYRPQS